MPGWRLDETNTGLAGVGIDKESLPLYQGSARPAPGTVIREMRIETALDLSAGGILIERCWIHPLAIGRGNQIIQTYDNNNDQAPAPAMVTLSDCDIDGTALSAYDVCFSSGFAGCGTVLRCHFYGMGSGIAVLHAGSTLDCVVEGNYIHGLRAWGDSRTTGSHNDGATIRGYTGLTCIFRNNRIDCSSGNDTGAFFVQSWENDIDNVLVQGNLLEGNGYQLILERNNHDYGRNLRALDNRFSGTGYGPGYVADGGLGYGWAEWSENYLNDPGQADNKGRLVEKKGP